jgi:hypothetical protein
MWACEWGSGSAAISLDRRSAAVYRSRLLVTKLHYAASAVLARRRPSTARLETRPGGRAADTESQLPLLVAARGDPRYRSFPMQAAREDCRDWMRTVTADPAGSVPVQPREGSADELRSTLEQPDR